MACGLRLPVGSLLLPRPRPRLDQHRHQPLGLGWGSVCAKGLARPSLCPLCIRCQAHAQSTEVSASDGTKKHSTWTHSDPFASPERYAGWEALDNKWDGDYWAGLLQVGAGVALAVGFALVSHAAYARRGGNRDAATSPAAVQDVQPAQRISSGVQDLPGVSATQKNSAGLASLEPEPEQTDRVAEDEEVAQGQEAQAQAANWHAEDEKTQQMAAPAAQVSPGRVVIPAVVDQVQEQALAVLQALKVVETGVEAGELCTRREYARWLINASNVLARSSSRKVFPAMYIENITDLAFDDVSPDDPDFAFIQGLAEAGLISSKLTLQDSPAPDSAAVLFAPDAPLSRQDLISWKLSLEGRTQTVDKKTLEAQSGFIDIDRIHEDAWPAISADLSAGDDSIIATAFGYTRRFHPDKPTTNAQAAVALVLGESAAVVADESARLQAEKIADQAVQEQLELEARALQEVDAALKEMLNLEKEGRLQAQSFADDLKSQLDSLKSEREAERLTLLKEHAAIDSDKQIISEYRRQLEEELESLATLRAELALEREREGSARAGVEQEREGVRKAKDELEVEKQALALARQWAEEEARNARAHSRVLGEVRKRWENQGIEVAVGEELTDNNIPEQTWKYAEANVDAVREASSPGLSGSAAAKEPDLSGPSDVEELRDRVVEFIQNGRTKVLEFVRKVVQALRDSLARLRAQAADKLSSVSQATENAWPYGRSKAEELRQGALSGVTGVSSTLTQGTKKVADALKEEAGKIAQKFKST